MSHAGKILCSCLLSGAPCLSFDVIRDNLGESREKFPLTCYMAAGTQSQRGKGNHIIVMKMSNLNRTSRVDEKDESDDESSESEDEDEKPELETAVMNHRSGCVNRIRVSLRTCQNLVKLHQSHF